MSVHHCLFWIRDNKITSILVSGDKFEIMKFGGYEDIEYTEDFWEEWKDFSGFSKSSQTDFCLIYDNKVSISEDLRTRECPLNECVWNRYNIQKAVDMLDIRKATQIYTENGACVAQAGNFRNVRGCDITKLTAEYRSAEKEIAVDITSAEITPFIKDMLEKLNTYDGEEA